MEVYKTANATVRIHGQPDQDKLRVATETFLKKVVRRRKEVERRMNDEKKQIAEKSA